jgi:two-component system, NarL family, response regulator
MSEPTTKIRVLTVDDHLVVRAGVRAIIDAEPDMEVVAEAADGPSALAAHAQHQPDIILLDLRLPGMSGPEVISALRARDPRATVIVLTSYDADEDIYRAIQAGARGYLLKGTLPGGVLEAAIRQVHAGQSLIAPEAAARLADRMASPTLTPREVAVLGLVAQGKSNKEICTALSLAEGTVKTYLQRIFEKLGVSDRTGAALLGVQRGIVTFW